MKILLFAILIFSAFLLRLAKKVIHGWETHTLRQILEKEAKKALLFAFKGVAVVGLFALAISEFAVVRQIGFLLISEEDIALIRALMEIFLGTNSVYLALGIFASGAAIVLQFAVIFSFVGFLLTKKFFGLYVVREEQLYADVGTECSLQSAELFVKKNILYNFAHLRI